MSAVIVAAPSIVLKTRAASRLNYSGLLRVPSLIVLHCTDGHEGARKDDDVAAMFADPKLHPPRSAGYVVDSDSATHCVPDDRVAWHCGRTGNRRGIGIEFCGRARQTREEWLDALSLPMLCIGARLVATLCERHSIPARFVDAAALVGSQAPRGITTHAEIAKAWRETRHTDPGPHFPLHEFVAAVATAMTQLPTV